MRHYLKRDETRQLVLTDALLLPKAHKVVYNNMYPYSDESVMEMSAEVMERLAALPYIVFAAEPSEYACMGVFEPVSEMNVRSLEVSKGIDSVMADIEDSFGWYDVCNFIVHKLMVKIFSEGKFRLILHYERVRKDEFSFTTMYRQYLIDSFLADNT